MPRKTDRQQETDAILNAFIIQLIAEAEIAAYCDHDSGSDSDSDSSLGSSTSDMDTSSTSDSMEVDDGVTDVLLEALAELHRTRYQDDRRNIPKTDANVRNLLTMSYIPYHILLLSILTSFPSILFI